MKISELWLTAQTQNEMVFSELNKVIQKVFLIISCSYQYFCILAFQFQRRDDYQWNTSQIYLDIRFAMHNFKLRFQKVEDGNLGKRFPCQWRIYRNPKLLKKFTILELCSRILSRKRRSSQPYFL